MRALVLQHVPFEGSARIGDWIGRHCEHEHVCYLYADAHLPALDSFDLLVVMGGPMSVHDEAQYPWLVAEKRLIRAALDAGKKVLGICLGAQLLAQALGCGTPGTPGGDRLVAAAQVQPGAGLAAGRAPAGTADGVPLARRDLRPASRQRAALWFGCLRQPGLHLERAGYRPAMSPGKHRGEHRGAARCPPAGPATEGAVQSAGRIRQGVAHCREVAPVLFLLLDYLAHRPAEIARRA